MKPTNFLRKSNYVNCEGCSKGWCLGCLPDNVHCMPKWYVRLWHTILSFVKDY